MFMQERNGGCETIKQEMLGSGHFSTEYNMFPHLHSTATSKSVSVQAGHSRQRLQWLPRLHAVATADSDDVFCK